MTNYPEPGEICGQCGTTEHLGNCPWRPDHIFGELCVALSVLRALHDEAEQHHAARMPAGAPPSAAMAAARHLLREVV